MSFDKLFSKQMEKDIRIFTPEDYIRENDPKMYNKIMSKEPYFQRELLKIQGLKFGQLIKIEELVKKYCLDKIKVKEAMINVCDKSTFEDEGEYFKIKLFEELGFVDKE